jgi:hypothetical protein
MVGKMGTYSAANWSNVVAVISVTLTIGALYLPLAL